MKIRKERSDFTSVHLIASKVTFHFIQRSGNRQLSRLIKTKILTGSQHETPCFMIADMSDRQRMSCSDTERPHCWELTFNIQEQDKTTVEWLHPLKTKIETFHANSINLILIRNETNLAR